MEKLGENIQKLRKQHGLTQQALAKQLFVSKSSISNYESGKNDPPHHVIVKLVDLFEISYDQLFDNLDNDSPTTGKVKKVKFTPLQDSRSPLQMGFITAALLSSILVLYLESIFFDVLFYLFWLVVIVYGIVLRFKSLNQTYFELDVPRDKEVFVKQAPEEEKPAIIPIINIIVKALVSFFAIMFAFVVYQEVEMFDSLQLFTVVAILWLFLHLLTLFVHVPIITARKPIPFKKLPHHFNMWLFQVLYSFDMLVLVFISILFLSGDSISNYGPFDLLLIPVLMITNIVYSLHMYEYMLKYYQGYKLYQTDAQHSRYIRL